MYFRKYFALAIAGMFVLCLLLLVHRLAKSSKPVRAFSGQCPDCGKKLLREGARCSYCEFLRRARGDAPDAPAAKELSPVGKLAIASGVLGLMTLGVYWSEARGLIRRWFTAPETTLVFRCRKCKRKLRYPVSSVGKTGLCPGCGVKFDFPDAEGKAPVPSETAAASE